MTQPLRRWYDHGPEITEADLRNLVNDALGKMDHPADHAFQMQRTTWTHDFPDTAGPHRGRLAGCAFTSFTVIGFEIEGGAKIKWCDGVWKEWDGIAKGW